MVCVLLVAHDLQAPLRNIATLTALLARGSNTILDQQSRDCAEMICRWCESEGKDLRRDN